MPKSPSRRTSMTMCRGMSTLPVRCGRELPGVQRKAVGQGSDGEADLVDDLFALDVVQNLRDEFRHFANLRLAESARGDRGTAEAHPAGVEGRIRIERNRVAVGRDVRGLERRLCFLTANSLSEHIRQQDMSVRAAGNNPESSLLEAFR